MTQNANQSIDQDNDIQGNAFISPLSNSLRSDIILPLEILSVICNLTIMIYIITHKPLRSAPHYYSLLILLCINFLLLAADIPMYIDFYRRGTVLFKNPTYCLAWTYIDTPLWAMATFTVAWSSFERHILIFHDRFLNSKWKKICFHFAPPLVLIVYVTCFYICAYYFYPCENSFDYQATICGLRCFHQYATISVYDLIVNVCIPPICDLIFCISLLIRLWYSKRRLRQTVNWRKYTRMAFQIISISALFLITLAPFVITYVISYFAIDYTVILLVDLAFFLTFFQPLLLPFLCLAWIPEMFNSLKKQIHRATAPRIVPQTSTKRNLKTDT